METNSNSGCQPIANAATVASVTPAISTPATAPRQRSKPLLPLRGVCSLVDKDENQVLELLESGEIAWAFDVALAQRRGRKREMRVLPAAVADYLKGRPCELDQPTVFSLLLPDGPTIPANQIARTLNVSVDHVYHLIDRKQIIACPTRRKGPGGSGRVAMTSFIKFLQKRRVL
jgi:hypothetical protein